MPNSQHVDAWQRLRDATRYSLKGVRACYRHEQAFRQEVWVLALVAPLGAWLGETGVERTLLIGSWLLVLIVELLNSAVEAVVDRVGSENHPLAGRAKDLGSAAVMVALILSAGTWGLILLD